MRTRRLIQRLIGQFQRFVIASLILLMVVTVFSSALDLGWLLLRDLLSPPILMMDVNELLDTFGLFLLVLIGLELLETFKAYLREHVIHVEVVFMVAMIAIARKVIILDVKELPSATLMGIAAIIIALSGAFYLFRRAGWSDHSQETETSQDG